MASTNAIIQKTSLNLPQNTIKSLIEEFDLNVDQVESFVTSLVERAVADHVSESNSNVLTKDEIKELEDDLQGLGYI